MKKGKKIVIGVAAVAVVAGGYKGGDRRCGRNCGCNRNGCQ